jgi:hypothetical protein
MLAHPGMGGETALALAWLILMCVCITIGPPSSMVMGANDVNRFASGYGAMPGPGYPSGSNMYPMAQTVNPMGGVAMPPGVSSTAPRGIGGVSVNQPQILPSTVNSSVPPNMRMPSQVPPSAGAMSMSSRNIHFSILLRFDLK